MVQDVVIRGNERLIKDFFSLNGIRSWIRLRWWLNVSKVSVSSCQHDFDDILGSRWLTSGWNSGNGRRAKERWLWRPQWRRMNGRNAGWVRVRDWCRTWNHATWFESSERRRCAARSQRSQWRVLFGGSNLGGWARIRRSFYGVLESIDTIYRISSPFNDLTFLYQIVGFSSSPGCSRWFLIRVDGVGTSSLLRIIR